MIGELSALGSALVGTLSTIVLKPQAGAVSAPALMVWRSLYGTIFYLALLPLFGGWQAIVAIPVGTLIILLVSTLLAQVLGDTLFYRSVSMFGVARIMPVASAYPVVTTILAVTLLNEPVDAFLVLGVLLVVGGLVLLTQGIDAQGTLSRGRLVGQIEHRPGRSSLLLLFAPPVVTGVGVYMIRLVLQDVSPVVVNAIRQPLAGVVLLTTVLHQGAPLLPAADRRRFLTTVTLGSFLGVGLGSVMFLLGIQLAGAARGGTLASTGPLFALVLSPLLLKEKITRRGIAGSILTVLGVWLII